MRSRRQRRRREIHGTHSAGLASPESPRSSAALRRRAISGPMLTPRPLARDFERAGAAALSVLVDERFGGSAEDLVAARSATAPADPGEGFLQRPVRARFLAHSGSRRRPAPPARSRRSARRAGSWLPLPPRTRPTRRGPFGARARASDRARSRPHRDQRTGPRQRSNRPWSQARPRRAAPLRLATDCR